MILICCNSGKLGLRKYKCSESLNTGGLHVVTAATAPADPPRGGDVDHVQARLVPVH